MFRISPKNTGCHPFLENIYIMMWNYISGVVEFKELTLFLCSSTSPFLPSTGNLLLERTAAHQSILIPVKPWEPSHVNPLSSHSMQPMLQTHEYAPHRTGCRKNSKFGIRTNLFCRGTQGLVTAEKRPRPLRLSHR